MCIACVEYLKDHLTPQELGSALRETTVEDAAHRAEVEQLVRDLGAKPEELKKALQKLAQK